MQQPGVERQGLKAVAGHSCSLAALQPVPEQEPQNGPTFLCTPNSTRGAHPRVGPQLPQCQGDGREAGWFLYLVLQLHDLVVLPVQLHVLVLHDPQELLDVVVLLLHKSLRAGRGGWRRVRSSRRPSAVVLPL